MAIKMGNVEPQQPLKKKYSTKALLSGLFILLVLLECVFSGLIVGVAALTGRDYLTIAHHLFATNVLASLVEESNPIEKATGARSLGHYSGRNSKDYYPADSLLGWRLGKSVAIVDQLNEYMVGISDIRSDGKALEGWRFTNDQGFMTSGKLKFHYAVPKPKNIFRIIMIGGSTVEGYGAEGYSNNLPAKLQTTLDQKISVKGMGRFETIEVINAGVGAYHSAVEYLYLVSELIQYEPNLVIVYDGNNDAVAGNYAIASPSGSPFQTETHQTNSRRINDSYYTGASFALFVETFSSEAIRLASRVSVGFTVLKLIEYFSIWLPSDERPVHVLATPPYSPKSVDNYKHNIERMALVAEQSGFDFAAFLQPSLGIDNKEYVGLEATIYKKNAGIIGVKEKFYAGARSAFGELKKKFSKNKRVCISDISGTVFRQEKQRVYTDHVHLFGSGNKTVAEKIVNELRKCDLLSFVPSNS
jgi:hypothetical protein